MIVFKQILILLGVNFMSLGEANIFGIWSIHKKMLNNMKSRVNYSLRGKDLNDRRI